LSGVLDEILVDVAEGQLEAVHQLSTHETADWDSQNENPNANKGEERIDDTTGAFLVLLCQQFTGEDNSNPNALGIDSGTNSIGETEHRPIQTPNSRSIESSYLGSPPSDANTKPLSDKCRSSNEFVIARRQWRYES
jgi:hypothetical protein